MSAPPPAAASAAPSTEQPAAPPAEAPASEAPPAQAPAAEPPPAPERRQSPIAILTARDAAFLVDYANSGARESADGDCDKEAKGDLAAKGACLQKARDKFLPDVLRFKKDEQGKISLLIYKRSGSALRELYIAAIDLVDETADSVRVKFLGREKGVRPLFKSGNSQISVPNDYSIEVDDPVLGKLTYNAKIGLVGSD